MQRYALERFVLLAATIAIGVAILFVFGDDGDGGTGPRPEPAPSIVPDRPPAEWFTEYAKR